MELSECFARAWESSHRDPFPSSMRLKRTRRPPRPSDGRIRHQKGAFQRPAWSDGRCPKVRDAIPIPARPGDLRILARLMQFPRVVIAHGGAGISVGGRLPFARHAVHQASLEATCQALVAAHRSLRDDHRERPQVAEHFSDKPAHFVTPSLTEAMTGCSLEARLRDTRDADGIHLTVAPAAVMQSRRRIRAREACAVGSGGAAAMRESQR